MIKFGQKRTEPKTPLHKKKSYPSYEQIREFWGWCGFKDCFGSEWFYERYKSTNHWYEAPNGRKYKDIPDLDLNNLSRYAIPKLVKEYRNWKSVLHDWVDELTGDYEKDILSLYWLLVQTRR